MPVLAIIPTAATAGNARLIPYCVAIAPKTSGLMTPPKAEAVCIIPNKLPLFSSFE